MCSLDQALTEVLEEEELKRLRNQKHVFEQQRDALVADAQRLEEATKRRFEEKERRLRQERERQAQEVQDKQKAAAKALAKEYVADLPESVPVLM